MTYAYDDQNIFAHILRKNIPCQQVYEDDWVLSFRDIHPRAPIHVLVIPKGHYANYSHFHEEAPQERIQGFWIGVHKTIDALGCVQEGYRLVTNQGIHGGQEVPHFHVHILGGHVLPV